VTAAQIFSCSSVVTYESGYVLTQITGGHLRPDLYGNIPKYIERYGVEAGAEVANFEISHIPALKKVIAEENIDCDLNLTRSMNVYLNEQEGEQARQIYEALVSRGLEYTSDLHYTPQKYAEKVC
jgi:hypothetical protein